MRPNSDNLPYVVNGIYYIFSYYRWTTVSTGDMFQDLPRLRKNRG